MITDRLIRPRVALMCACLVGVALLCGCAKSQSVTASGTAGSSAASDVVGGSRASSGSAAEATAAPSDAAAVTTDSLQPPSYAGYEPLVSFTYHHVDPKLTYDIAITPATFEAQLKALKAAGFESVTVRDLLKHQTDGTPLPAKPLMLTFDDGWRNQFQYAAPLLDKYGFKGVFFINPQTIGTYPGYMTRDMIVSLDQRGHDIENHTWQHIRLTRTRDVSESAFQVRTKRQLTLADKWIKAVTGKKPVALCYPFGYYDTEAIAFARANGYKFGFTVDEGVADARPWDAMAMKRFTMDRSYSLATFMSLVNAAPLQVRDIQPGPASRVPGLATTIRMNVSEVPASVKDIKIFGGPSVKATTITESGGQRFAEAPLVKSAIGLKPITVKGRDSSGRKYFASWVLTMGDLKK